LHYSINGAKLELSKQGGKMDNMLLEELSKAIGVKLTVRDTNQLERDTLDMQYEKLCRKQQAARQTLVCEIDEEAAMGKSGKLD